MSTKISIAKIKSEADRAYNKADDMHLLASIQNRIKQGLTPLIQPISLKKIDANPVYDYVVEDGRRRFKALDTAGITEIELGQDAVLIDGDSEVNAYVANQHTNLSLAEEIKKLYSMREKFKTLDTVAAEIGHSPTWVARRLNLMNLSDLWKKAMAEKVFGYMSIAHYETIATFPPTIQDEIFDYIRSVEGRDMKSLSIRKFSETLYEKFATLLSSLPWKEEGCGECPACKERKESGYLFANLIPEPRCMNREYLEKKRKEYVASLAAKEPETLLVSNNYPTREDDKKDENDPLAENTVLGPDEWKESDRKEDAVPAIIADGPRAGTKIMIQRPKAAESEKPKHVKTLLERKEQKNKQRQRKAIEKLITAIKEGKTDTPDRTAIYKMIACKGAHAVCGEHFDFRTKKHPNPLGLTEKIISFTQVPDTAELDSLMWKSVCENIVTELEHGQSGSEPVCWDEAFIISDLVHFDLEKAFDEATKELPDPKSWEILAKAEEKAKQKMEKEAA